MAADFLIGPVSQGAAKVLAVAVGGYAIGTLGQTLRAFQERLPDRGSAFMATLVMALLTWMLWVDGARLLPAPFSMAALGIYMAGVIITFAYTLSNAAKNLEKAKQVVKAALDEWAERTLPDEMRDAWMRERIGSALGDEEKRKTPHLMMGVFLIIYGILGWAILRGVVRSAPPDAASEVWHNVHAVLDAGVLASGHMVAMVCMLGLLFLLVPVELVRLRFPEMDYPFKGTINSLLRDREQGLFGAHYYIAATLPMAVFWITQDTSLWNRSLYAVLAVFCITVFADAASALVGVRFGRTKWPHNTNKSFMGTFGGTATALLLALPFVGLPVAIASAAVFFLVDVLAPVPFSASDNILNPLALAVMYVAMMPFIEPMLPFY